MPKAIQDYCRETGQPVPETKGELVRCCCESLALKYREVTGHLEELTGGTIEAVHVVGGGSQNSSHVEPVHRRCLPAARAGRAG